MPLSVETKNRKRGPKAKPVTHVVTYKDGRVRRKRLSPERAKEMRASEAIASVEAEAGRPAPEPEPEQAETPYTLVEIDAVKEWDSEDEVEEREDADGVSRFYNQTRQEYIDAEPVKAALAALTEEGDGDGAENAADGATGDAETPVEEQPNPEAAASESDGTAQENDAEEPKPEEPAKKPPAKRRAPARSKQRKAPAKDK